MYRIGIIGTENSHAGNISRIINLPNPETGKLKYPDTRITGIYGPDPDSVKKIMDEVGVDYIAKEPEEFFGKVEAMCIVCRKGSLHEKYALPFIEKGIPVFIDKPFTSDVAEAESLIAAAKKSGARIYGGSILRIKQDVAILKNTVKCMIAKSEFISACLNGTADPSSEYDGFFFYSPHLTETALEIFGKEVRSIAAFDKNGDRTAVWRYDNFQVTLNYTVAGRDPAILIYGSKGNIYRDFNNTDAGSYKDITLSQEILIENFLNMVHNGTMLYPYEDFVVPVKMISAINESVRTGKEIFI